MKSTLLKETLASIKTELIESIGGVLNGVESEFTSNVVFDAQDEYDPALFNRVSKTHLVVGNSQGEDTKELETLSVDVLFEILEELEQGNFITYSAEVTE